MEQLFELSAVFTYSCQLQHPEWLIVYLFVKSVTMQLMEMLKIVPRSRLNKPKSMTVQCWRYYFLFQLFFNINWKALIKSLIICLLMLRLSSVKFPKYLCSSLILRNHGLGITFQTQGDLMSLCKCQGVVLLHIQLRRWDEIGTTIEVPSHPVNLYIRDVII